MKGIAILCDTYKEQINDEMFIDPLGKMPVKELIRKSKDRGVGAHCYAEVMLNEYNKRTKQKLQYAKLYSARGKYSRKKYDIAEMLDELESEGIDPDIMSTDFDGDMRKQFELEEDE